jgi:multidrug efflux pump subunit AcrB
MSKGSSSSKYSAVTLIIISISAGARLRPILMTAFAFILGLFPLCSREARVLRAGIHLELLYSAE